MSKEDIFEEAAEAFLNNDSEKPVEQKTQNELALDIAEGKDDTWEELTTAIKGKYADRFMSALDALPDREFLRNYLKVLEYFVPKVNRQEVIDRDKIDNTLVIVVEKQSKKDNTIDVTHGE